MRRNSQFYFLGFLAIAVATVFCLPSLWRQLTGQNKEYDPGGLAFLVALLLAGNIGFLFATFRARRKEAAAEPEQRSRESRGAETTQPDAFVRLDFARTFPHLLWISSISYDSEAPDGFRYKMFATRHEPEMIIELLLLRETADGRKRKVFHMQATIDKLSTADDVIREIERDKNVCFERFDLSEVRTFDEFRTRAIQIGWEEAHVE